LQAPCENGQIFDYNLALSYPKEKANSICTHFCDNHAIGFTYLKTVAKKIILAKARLHKAQTRINNI